MSHCDYCHCRFNPSRKNQKYCTRPDCRRRRKNEWQKKKLQKDPDYRAAQREAQKRWRLSHPDYWRKYRKQNPDYTDRNRHLQGPRNKKRSMRGGSSSSRIAKMDAEPPYLSGTYYILPAISMDPDMIAKMDTKVFKIQPVIQSGEKSIDCKERTHTQMK